MVSQAKDIKASRTQLANKAVKLIKDNTMFHGKLKLPTMEKSRLLEIVMQGYADILVLSTGYVIITSNAHISVMTVFLGWNGSIVNAQILSISLNSVVFM